MRSPIEIDVVMDGSVIRPIKLAVLGQITIRLAKAGYLPLTSMLISDIREPHRISLRISYDYWPDVISDLNTLYLLDALLPEKLSGDGSNTEE